MKRAEKPFCFIRLEADLKKVDITKCFIVCKVTVDSSRGVSKEVKWTRSQTVATVSPEWPHDHELPVGSIVGIAIFY